jgi:type I restriction enzyme S subunit
MGEWRSSTWGNEITLEYGKALRGYSEVSGRYRVFGSNGPIGWTSEPLAAGPGVILGRKGAYRGVCFSREPFFVIDTAYYAVPKTTLDMCWLYYAIIYHRLGEIDDGSPIPSTTRSAVYVRDVDIPPPDEQRAIATILCALDDKIELNRRMDETLEAMARAIFDREAASGGWQERHLGDLCEIYDGPHATPKLVTSGPIFLGISNLANGLLNLSDTNHVTERDFVKWTRRVKPESGDVVFSYETRLGQAALIPEGLKCCLGRRMGLLRVRRAQADPNVILRAYLAGEFQETIRRRTIHGSTVHRIPLKEMSAFPIRVPVADEMGELGLCLSPLRRRVEHNERESVTLVQLRDLLLPKLMSGEIRVHDAERLAEAAQ